MELIKNTIQMDSLEFNKEVLSTIEEDINVPENKPDIIEITAIKCQIGETDFKIAGSKATVNGHIVFTILYGKSQIEKDITFNENIALDEEISDYSNVKAECMVYEYSGEIINSRKYCVRTIIQINLLKTENKIEEVVTSVNENNIQTLYETINPTQLVLLSKDIYRVKQEIEIGKNKPNIGSVLWNTISLNGYETKLLNNQIEISGRLCVFIMYKPEDEQLPVSWIENNAAFKGVIDANSVSDKMIHNIFATLGKCDITIKNNEDGEPRIFVVDGIINMDIKIYQELELSILKDMYKTDGKIIPKKKNITIYKYLQKNCSKVNIKEKADIDEEESILSVCNSYPEMKIEEANIEDDKIIIDGVIKNTIIYITNNDVKPLKSKSVDITFSHEMEIDNISKECKVAYSYGIDYEEANMTGDNSIEIKAIVNICAFVLEPVTYEVIDDVQIEELTKNEIDSLPGITGYIALKDDSLWNIAKENYTTVDNIKKINNITTDEIKEGDKIIIVKQAMEII